MVLKMNRRLLLYATLLAPLMLGSLSARAADTVKVAASFSVLGDMVKQIGGDRVEVKAFVGPNGDAHVYEPTPGDAKALVDAAGFPENPAVAGNFSINDAEGYPVSKEALLLWTQRAAHQPFWPPAAWRPSGRPWTAHDVHYKRGRHHVHSPDSRVPQPGSAQRAHRLVQEAAARADRSALRR